MHDEERDNMLDGLAAYEKQVQRLEDELEQSRQEIARLTAVNADFRDWARCAHGFAWAHENTCPRNHGHACDCGLDAFLARPRIVMDGYRATLRDIAQAIGLHESATAEDVLRGVREAVEDRERIAKLEAWLADNLYHYDLAIQSDEEDGVWFAKLWRYECGELRGSPLDDSIDKPETIRAALDAIPAPGGSNG